MYEIKYFIDTYLYDILTFGSVLLVGFAVCGLIGIPYYFSKKTQKKFLWLKDNGERTEGWIVSLYTKSFSNDLSLPAYTPCADYCFSHERQDYKGEFVRDKKQFYQLGDTITVYYNRNNPAENCTDRHIEEGTKINRMLLIFISSLAVLSVIFAFVTLFITSRG